MERKEKFRRQIPIFQNLTRMGEQKEQMREDTKGNNRRKVPKIRSDLNVSLFSQ